MSTWDNANRYIVDEESDFRPWMGVRTVKTGASQSGFSSFIKDDLSILRTRPKLFIARRECHDHPRASSTPSIALHSSLSTHRTRSYRRLCPPSLIDLAIIFSPTSQPTLIILSSSPSLLTLVLSLLSWHTSLLTHLALNHHITTLVFHAVRLVSYLDR